MERIRTEATIPMLVRNNARTNPEGIAIVDGDRRYTFAQFDRAMVEAVQAMMAFGIKPGDRAAVWAPNSVDWLIIGLGIMGAGGVLLPTNNRLKSAELADVVERTGVSAVFTVDRFLDVEYARSLRETLADPDVAIIDIGNSYDGGAPGVLHWRDLLEKGLAEVTPEAAEERIASIETDAYSDIITTSGTTGAPKGVLMTHRKSLMNTEQYVKILGLDESDAMLLIPPLGLLFGFKFIFLLGTLTCSKVVIQSVFTADETMKLIDREGITYFPGPPTLIQDIIDSPARDGYDISSLRHILLAGTTIQPRLIDRIKSESIASRVSVGYGLSETMAVAMTRADDDPDKIATTVGRIFPGVQVRILGDDDQEVGPGEGGEIVVRTPTVMIGYYNDPALTQAAFTPDGWFRTGDTGVLDDQGYLTIIGRKKDMYIAGGFNVYPAEVEKCLIESGLAGHAAVVSIPDARLGEVGVAFVVPPPGGTIDVDALMQWSKKRLANYKVPRTIIPIEALPINANGKVLREELRAQAVERSAAAA